MQNMLKSCVAATVLATAAISFVPEEAVAGPVGLSSQAGVSLTSPTEKVALVCYHTRRYRRAYYGYARPVRVYAAAPAYYAYAAPAPAYYGYAAAAPAYYGYGGGCPPCPGAGYYGAAYPYGGAGYYGWGGGLGFGLGAAAATTAGLLGGWWW